MIYDQVCNEIRKQWTDNFQTTVFFDNQPFVKRPDTPHVRFTIRWGSSEQTQIGVLRRFRQQGDVLIQIFHPTGSGDKASNQFVNSVIDKFGAVTLPTNGVVFMTPYPTPIGESDGWWQVDVACPFYFDYTKESQ